MDKFEEISKSEVGDRISLFGQKRRFTVMARSERFVILSKNCFGQPLYTIVDLQDEWMGPDSLIFGLYDYSDKDDCKKVIKALENKDFEISYRRGLSFENYRTTYNYKEVENAGT